MVIRENGPEVLTAKMGKAYSECSYSIKEAKQEEVSTTGRPVRQSALENVVTSSRLRNTNGSTNPAAIQDTIARHQKELHKRSREEAMRRLQMYEGDEDEDKKNGDGPLISYETHDDLPTDVSHTQIYIHMSKETILFPINSNLVPFHISTIKNVSKTEEERSVLLRINFHIPSATGKTASNSTQTADPNQIFIKELNYRSRDTNRLNNCFRFV